jgi:hypothetical protein
VFCLSFAIPIILAAISPYLLQISDKRRVHALASHASDASQYQLLEMALIMQKKKNNNYKLIYCSGCQQRGIEQMSNEQTE